MEIFFSLIYFPISIASAVEPPLLLRITISALFFNISFANRFASPRSTRPLSRINGRPEFVLSDTISAA